MKGSSRDVPGRSNRAADTAVKIRRMAPTVTQITIIHIYHLNLTLNRDLRGMIFVRVQKLHNPRYEDVAKLPDAVDFDRCHRIGIAGSASRDFKEPEKQLAARTMSAVPAETVENQTGYEISAPLPETIRSTVLIATGAEPYLHFISIRHCVFSDPGFCKGGTVIDPFSHIIDSGKIAAGNTNRQ